MKTSRGRNAHGRSLPISRLSPICKSIGDCNFIRMIQESGRVGDEKRKWKNRDRLCAQTLLLLAPSRRRTLRRRRLFLLLLAQSLEILRHDVWPPVRFLLERGPIGKMFCKSSRWLNFRVRKKEKKTTLFLSSPQLRRQERIARRRGACSIRCWCCCRRFRSGRRRCRRCTSSSSSSRRRKGRRQQRRRFRALVSSSSTSSTTQSLSRIRQTRPGLFLLRGLGFCCVRKWFLRVGFESRG